MDPEIHDLISDKKWTELKRLLSGLTPPDVAEHLQSASKQDRVILYRALHRQLAAETFAYLDQDEQDALLEALTDQETRDLLQSMSPDDRTALLEELPAAATQRLFSLLSHEHFREASMLLGYPENSVGRLMSPDYASVRADQTVSQAFESIRTQAPGSETIQVIYVVDEEGRLLDDVRLRYFIISPPDAMVRDIMDGQCVSLSAFADQEEAVEVMRKYDSFVLPVVDSTGILIGIVTADDVLDVVEEEATEDIHKAGALNPLHTSLLKASFTQLYSRRISWLVLLVFVNILSGAGIAFHEELIESMVALVFFLPLLIASGGNSGSQAATITIRSMALGDVGGGDFWRVLLKECAVSMALGLTMAAAIFLVGWWRAGSEIALVAAASMVAIVIIGSVIGVSLPFVLNKFKMDPAAASTPLVTSLADIAGVVIYLGIAQALLGVARG
jgi:magnesium transporter